MSPESMRQPEDQAAAQQRFLSLFLRSEREVFRYVAALVPNVATAWLQWQLKDDKEAARMFVGEPCGLATVEGWKVEKKNIP